MRFAGVVAIVLAISSWCGPLSGQCPIAEFAAPGDGGEFGISVSLRSLVAVVGARMADGADLESGAAYVYRFGGADWAPDGVLTASDGAPGDEFGSAVIAAGGSVFVGARAHDEMGVDSGAVYVYRHAGGGWLETQKLVPVNATANDRFGHSLANDGNRLLIGAPLESAQGVISGAAYVFVFDGNEWVEEQKLVAADTAASDLLGWSVALSGDVALISAHRDDDFGRSSGAAYIFRRIAGEWVEEAKLLPTDPTASAWFGYSVALTGAGQLAVIGAVLDDAGAPNAGSAYVFALEDGSWIERQKLTVADGAADELFGFAVAARPGTIIVAAVSDGEAGRGAGAIHSFRDQDGVWVPDRKILPSGETAGVEFGTSVSATGSRVLVGARFGFGAGGAVGNAELHELFADCNGNCISDAEDIDSGTSSDANGDGIPDECQRSFIRGDTNGGGFVDFLDGLLLISYFYGEAELPCLDTGDFNDDGSVSIEDFLELFEFTLSNGPAPPSPYPACGLDPTLDGLADFTCPEPPPACP